jgi:hypothetical protein
MSDDTISNETKLWRAVIYQALLDATKPEADNEPQESVNDREKAIRWLTIVSGVTAAYFSDVCDFAGFNPSLMKQTAIRITNDPTGFPRKRLNVLLRNEASDETYWYTERFTIMASTSI